MRILHSFDSINNNQFRQIKDDLGTEIVFVDNDDIVRVDFEIREMLKISDIRPRPFLIAKERESKWKKKVWCRKKLEKDVNSNDVQTMLDDMVPEVIFRHTANMGISKVAGPISGMKIMPDDLEEVFRKNNPAKIRKRIFNDVFRR